MRGVVICVVQAVCLARTGSPEVLLSPLSGRPGKVHAGFLPKGIPREFVLLLSRLSVAKSAGRILVVCKQNVACRHC